MMRSVLLKLGVLCGFLFVFIFEGLTQSMSGVEDLIEHANDLILEEEIIFEVQSPAKAIEKVSRKIMLFNEESHQRHVAVGYDNHSKAKWIEGAIYDGKGKLVRKIKSKDLNDVSYQDGFSIQNDARYYYVEMSYSRYPYIIEYAYEIKHQQVSSYPDWNIQSYGTAVLSSSYEISIPSIMTFHQRVLNVALEPKVTKGNGLHAYRYEVRDLPAIKKEKYSPNAKEVLPKLLVAPDEFEVDGYSGSMRSWKDFGAFLFEINRDRDILSPAMAEKVKHLIKEAGSDREKIAILYDYLKSTMRYVSVQVGIGGWQTFDAPYVEQNKYGDCKALSNFMRAMLRTAGISSNLVVTHLGDNYYLEDDFVSPGSFNHMILYVPTEDSWLECTSKSYPPGYIGMDNVNRKALLLSSEGGKLVSTPSLRPSDNLMVRRDTITWKGDKIIVSGEQIHTNGQHEFIRAFENRISEKEQEEWFVKRFPLSIHAVNELQFKASPIEPVGKLSYQVEVIRFGSKSGNRMFVPANALENFSNRFSKGQDRHVQIVTHSSYRDTCETFISFPNGYEIESLPEKTSYEHPEFGIYELWFEKHLNGAVVHRVIEIRPLDLAPERFDEVYDFYSRISKADNANIVLKKKLNKT